MTVIVGGQVAESTLLKRERRLSIRGYCGVSPWPSVALNASKSLGEKVVSGRKKYLESASLSSQSGGGGKIAQLSDNMAAVPTIDRRWLL